ncbi:MAG: transporter substrate-binding domain-containing protein [Fretibacterium sp.]|nr:transporter substrate-binding domain-containing protein [Fretibacterium sp.]
MNKILCVLLMFLLMCGGADADVKVGFLEKLNTTEEEYRDLLIEDRKHIGWNLLSDSHEGDENFIFFNSLLEMQMALIRGDIDEVALPKAVAEYMLNTSSELAVSSIERIRTVSFALGFDMDNAALRDRFNSVLRDMKSDGTLSALQIKYLQNPGTKEWGPVTTDYFEGAETLIVAVTGDLPPIDFVAEDGRPLGFNAAVLADIGRRLRMNIELLDIDAGARQAALVSGRADVVFWYLVVRDVEEQVDVPDNVLLSEPYYDWDKFMYIRKKEK